MSSQAAWSLSAACEDPRLMSLAHQPSATAGGQPGRPHTQPFLSMDPMMPYLHPASGFLGPITPIPPPPHPGFLPSLAWPPSGHGVFPVGLPGLFSWMPMSPHDASLMSPAGHMVSMPPFPYAMPSSSAAAAAFRVTPTNRRSAATATQAVAPSAAPGALDSRHNSPASDAQQHRIQSATAASSLGAVPSRSGYIHSQSTLNAQTLRSSGANGNTKRPRVVVVGGVSQTGTDKRSQHHSDKSPSVKQEEEEEPHDEGENHDDDHDDDENGDDAESDQASPDHDGSTSSSAKRRQVSPLPSSSVDDANTRYICPVYQCSRAFKSQESLEKHAKCHEHPKTIPCSHAGCTRMFPTAEALRRHSRFHTGERPYICRFAASTGCSKTFSDLTNAKRHEKTHTGERPYKCFAPDCPSTFIRRSALRLHMTRVHQLSNSSELLIQALMQRRSVHPKLRELTSKEELIGVSN